MTPQHSGTSAQNFSYPTLTLRTNVSAGYVAFVLCAMLMFISVPRTQAQMETAVTSTRAPQLANSFGNVPLSFEPNRGQTDSRVQFLARGQGYALFLTPGEAVLELQKNKTNKAGAASSSAPQVEPAVTIGMQLIGSNLAAKVTGDERLPGTVNYFTGTDQGKWKTGLPTYGRVRYDGVYPGVDLVYYGNQRQLEYDFVIAPKADPSRIALAFTGAAPHIDAAGDLVLALAAGDTRFHKPVVYQMNGERKVSVDASYQIASGTVRFAVAAYDHSKPLVIDPVLSYLTYIGGSQSDLINGIAIDSSGSAYVVARALSSDYPLKNAYQSSNAGLLVDSRFTAIAVSKFNAAGTALVYSTYLNGTSYSVGNAIAVDSGGNAYVGGYTQSNDYPITPGAYLTYCNNGYALAPGGTSVVHQSSCGTGGTSGVITKLNPAGTALVYSTYLGGDDFNEILAVAVDSAGQAYVTGTSNAACSPPYYPDATHPGVLSCQSFSSFPVTNGSAQDPTGLTFGSNSFAFLTKFNAAGSALLYSSVLGDATAPPYHDSAPSGNAIAIDASGNAYIGGVALSYFYTTPGSYQPSVGSISGGQAFVAKFDTVAQKLLYSTFIDGTRSGGVVYGMAADAAGNAYAAGSTNDCSFPTTTGAYETQASYPSGTTINCNAGFVSKLNPSGSALLWSTFVGNNASGNNNTYLSSLALGSDGSVYVAGTVSGTGFPYVNPTQTQTDFNSKALIARLNPSGSAMLFATSLGGVTTSSDSASGIAVDPSGNIYVAGQTNSYTLPVTAGAFQATSKLATPCCGNVTGFVAKIAPAITSTTTLTLPTNVTAGQPATFTARVAGPTGTSSVPTGTVTFSSGSTTLGTATLDAAGTATYTAPSLNGTTYTVTASYAGDTSFSSSVSAAQPLVVSPAAATVALTAPTTATPGSSVTLSVKVTGTGGTPTGSVTFKDGATILSTVALVSGSASYTSTAFALGTHTLTVSYTGDSIFSAATSSAQTLIVGLATSTVTLTAPSTALVGASVTLSASVAGTPGTPTGSITFKDGSTVLSTVTLVSGAASYSTSALSLGAHPITATYSGDTTFSPAVSSSSTVTISVAPAITFAASPASLTVTHGMSATSVITGTPVGGYTGTVTFACGPLPTAASCTFAPTSLTFTGNNTASSTTLTFSTSMTTAGALQPLHGLQKLGGVLAALLLVPFTLRKKRITQGGRLLLWLLIAAGSASLVALSGCSGSPSTITTPAGSYTVPVVVTAGSTTSTLNLAITVQ